ncbi:MAG TPA: cytochrome oxidase subunit I, partial [Cyclobacteriaceae bacterium]|nr:cytochrome oxidase subunit I [Cyclobacteriaceae bacterium]
MNKKNFYLIFALSAMLLPTLALAQSSTNPENWLASPGIIGTFFLIAIVLVIAIVIILLRAGSYLQAIKERKLNAQKLAFDEGLIGLDEAGIDDILLKRKQALKYRLAGGELGSAKQAVDEKGLVSKVSHDPGAPLVDEKRQSPITFETPPDLKRVIVYYLGASAFWLVFGTLVGQYLGMKFVWPDMDHVAWLSFGRLRPVHT